MHISLPSSHFPDSAISISTQCGSSFSKITPTQSSNSFDLVDFRIKKLLAESNSKVYLVQSHLTRELYALKLYPYEDGRPDQLFQNEIQYSQLDHPNIIKTVATRGCYTLKDEETSTIISYILQEYAPYGDFFELLISREIELSDKLIRTYFHQLIKGLEYLHQNNIGHLDIKVENLLLNKSFQLQISDFDLAKPLSVSINEPWGSQMYRAPELREGNCQNLKAADIYSSGIVLFVLKSEGNYPFLEDVPCKSQMSYYEDAQEGLERFWNHHTVQTEKSSHFYDSEFRELFLSMVEPDSRKRASIQDIKRSAWYNREVYSDSELMKEMDLLLNPY